MHSSTGAIRRVSIRPDGGIVVDYAVAAGCYSSLAMLHTIRALSGVVGGFAGVVTGFLQIYLAVAAPKDEATRSHFVVWAAVLGALAIVGIIVFAFCEVKREIERDQREARQSQLLKELADAAGRPTESLRARLLATSSAILSLLSRKRQLTPLDSVVRIMSSQAGFPTPEQEFERKRSAEFFSDYSARVIDLNDEAERSGFADEKLAALVNVSTPNRDQMREIAQRLGDLARAMN